MIPEAALESGLQELIDRGLALIRSGDSRSALQCVDHALALEPAHLLALRSRASILFGLGDFEEAQRALEALLRLAPLDTGALMLLGLVHTQRADHPAAIACFARLVSQAPGHVDAWLSLGIALRLQQRHVEAECCLARALQLDPRQPQALLNRGLALGQLERDAEALECFEALLEIQPDQVFALINGSVALGRLGRHHEALSSAERAVTLAPDNAGAHAQWGFALAQVNRPREALASLDRALQLDPGHSDASEHRGFVCLGLGQLPEGFRARESRWERPPLAGTRLETSAPLWLGGASLGGRTLLLQHEQGFGDTLQFIRYAPQLARRDARVIVRVPAALASLVTAMPGVSAVVSEPAAPPPHDLWCPLMSLPLAFGTTLQTIPAATPYLQPPPAQVAAWAARLGPKVRPRIGIAWAGRQYGRPNSPRDMPLRTLLPLLDLDADFVSLQKDPPPQDRALLDTLPQLRRYGETVTDFADTAALIGNLDLVIAVDTAVVHLAGAIGKPVWLMNRFASCWRWLYHGDRSHWYPRLHQFRQETLGDWNGVVHRICKALRLLLVLDTADFAAAASAAQPGIATPQ